MSNISGSDATKRAAHTALMLLVGWSAWTMQGCCCQGARRGNDTTPSASGSAPVQSASAGSVGSANPPPPPPQPPPPRQSTCKYTKEKVVLKCDIEHAEACSEKEILCRSSYFSLHGKSDINNWEKTGVWKDRVNKISFVTLNVGPKVEKQSGGRFCLKGSAHADVWLCWADASKVPQKVDTVSGYGKMYKYEQGILTDDLYVDMLDVYSKEDGAKEAEAMNFDHLLSAGTDSPAKRIDVLKALQATEEKLSKNEAYRIALLRGVNIEEVRAKAQEDALLAEAERKSRLTASSFLRLEAVSSQLKHLTGNEWVLASTATCGKDAPGKDEFERKANSAKKEQLAKELGARLYLVDLSIEKPESKAGEYNFSTKKLPLILSAKQDDVALSGVASVKTETIMEDYCCTPLGICRPADGILVKSCTPGEIQRQKPYLSMRTFDDKSTVKNLSLTLEPNVAEEVTKQFAELRGRAVVKIKGATRICEEGNVGSQKLLAEVVGVRLQLGEKAIYESAQVEVSVDDAMGGEQVWLEKKLAATPKK